MAARKKTIAVVGDVTVDWMFMNPGGGPMMGTTTRGAPDVGSRSTVPYYEVMPEYSRVAEEALTKEEVPPAYRKTVREYFDALQSGAPEQARTEE